MPHIAKINSALTSKNGSNTLPISNLKIKVDKNVIKDDENVID